MAVYTPVDADALAALLAQYDLGEALAFEPIASGVENTNYFLDTGAGRHVLTLFERRTEEADLPYFLQLTEHLAARGVPAPRPRRRRDGGLVSRACGKPAAIVERLPGRAVEAAGAGETAAGAAALARMHVAARDFGMRRDNPLGPDGLRTLARGLEGAGAAGAEGLAEARRLAADALDVWAFAPLPRGPAHTDLFPDNVLFDAGAVSGVFDFYFACDEAYAYDLAVVLVSWRGADGRFDPAAARAAVDAYDRVRRLRPEERSALPSLCAAACFRFFLTRLYDAAHPREDALAVPKDPLEYLVELEFFAGFDDWKDIL